LNQTKIYGELQANFMLSRKYSLRLSKTRTNLAANPGRSPLMRSSGYASAGDRPTLFARFALGFAPFVQYAG
jgi:hypothetical protein